MRRSMALKILCGHKIVRVRTDPCSGFDHWNYRFVRNPESLHGGRRALGNRHCRTVGGGEPILSRGSWWLLLLPAAPSEQLRIRSDSAGQSIGERHMDGEPRHRSTVDALGSQRIAGGVQARYRIRGVDDSEVLVLLTTDISKETVVKAAIR